MKVIYRSRKRRPYEGNPGDKTPVLELSWKNWDDFTYKTTFDATLHIGEESGRLDQIRILFEDQLNSSVPLEKLIEGGWSGEFPPNGLGYISNPSSITFYEQIAASVGTAAAAAAAAAVLRDASFLIRYHDDEEALAMTLVPGFRLSLQRERGSQNAFAQGWKLFAGERVEVGDFRFSFVDQREGVQQIKFNYSSSSMLPHDINLIVGPNGAGKSQLLTQLVDHWLQIPGLAKDTGFSDPPPFNRFIALSYSPFERLRVDTNGLNLASTDIYRYFGLRGRGLLPKQAPTLALTHARKSAVSSLIACAEDDQRFSAIKAWSQKLKTLHDVLRQAIDFDFAAVSVPATTDGKAFLKSYGTDPTVDVTAANGRMERYVRIDQDSGPELAIQALTKQIVTASGITLFKHGRPLEMSSGQRLFSYVVINVLGSIRRNSLVLIDEPELFLHPTLEIELVSMLKSILHAYESKALIATHSLVITREVPRDCVHVFHPTEDGLVINHPPFQTFGGDVQRISSYVFGGNSVSKPFEKWIAEQVDILGDREAVLARIPEQERNEELIIELTSGMEDLA